MKRALAMILTLALAAALLAVPAAAAPANVFTPTEDPGETAQETAVDTGIPGMTLTLGADTWSLGEAENITSATGVTYPTFLTGKANPKVEEKTGTYYVFSFDDSVKTGSLELMYRLNSGKAFYILDNGQAMKDFDGMKVDVSADLSTTIIVEGGHSYTVYAKGSKLRLYGCAFQNVEPKEVFAQEIAAFPFDRVKGTNADAAHVDEDLALVDSYESQFGSCDVSWTSSDPSVIDVDGTVNCQKTETAVTLTGHFSVQERREFAADVVIELTVLADPDDASAVDVAADVLTLGDLSAVKRDLELPAKGKRGTSITWTSSEEKVVGADGKVYPAPNADQSAILTATITRGDATRTKEFPVTVAGVVPVVLNSWCYSGADGRGRRFTPEDGGWLATATLTCNDPNPDPADVFTLSIYAADGTLKTSKDFNMAEWFDGIGAGDLMCMAVGMHMDSTDYFELTARNTRTGEALITPVRADDSLTGGAKVYVVGDSTASVYGDDRYPRKGWAQMLGGYFDGVEVVDLALSGRSSRSFKNEANYATLKNSLKKGDYLIIQFGHNDDKADAYADPEPDYLTARQDPTSFQSSMLEYIQLAWEKGAHPILATSISRRKLSDEALEKYVRAAQALSSATCTPCIDLYGATNGWINEVGVDAAQDMFNCVKPHDSRFMDYPAFTGSEFYEKGSSDDTHINLYGADVIAEWFVKLMAEQGLPLAAKVNGYHAQWPLPTYAQATEVALPTFVDVERGSWYAPGVDYAVFKGLFQGVASDRFAPGDTMTRAMLLTVLARLDGQDTAGGGTWYEKGLAWAVAQGISDGAAPEGDITREQLVTMLYRYAKAEAQGDLTSFADAAQISDWAKEATAWAVSRGILTGKDGGLLDPQGTATRAEVAVILQRFLAQNGK